MGDERPEQIDAEALAKRRVPCMVAFLHPFRLVNGPSSPPWDPKLEDVNWQNWDYVELHRLVGGIDVGLATPYHMVVARDGAMGLPPLADLRGDQEAVEFFNRSFAALLLGGVYCEAIGLDGLDFGSILDWTFLRIHTHAPANHFNDLVRLKKASAFEAISLIEPRSISMGELTAAMRTGRALLEASPQVSGEFLLKGVTGIARRDWGTALANLWIVIEQITSSLWTRTVLNRARTEDSSPGRLNQLEDTRTWTTATKHELLHQIGLIPVDALSDLSSARKSRNALTHTGNHPSEMEAEAAYAATLALLQISAPDLPIPLKHLNLKDHSLSDPFLPHEPQLIEPTLWSEIPSLPGEAEIQQLGARYRQQHDSDG
jgi:hypothetical protein